MASSPDAIGGGRRCTLERMQLALKLMNPTADVTAVASS